ncbi:MAG: M6 family metalloprotease domain-containing protein, partial [Chloroflexi bacterium]
NQPPVRQPAERGQNFGTQPVLLVLVDYSNTPHLYAESNFQTSFFGTSNSIADYYKTASFNNLTIGKVAETYGTTNDGVVGWLRLAGTFAIGMDEREIARNALTAANPYVNYATYDTDGNGFITSTELHLVIVVSGYEQSYCGPTCMGVWAHRWTISSLVLDGKTVATDSSDGKYGGYSMFGEIHGLGPSDSNRHPATIGVMVHELGHDLSWPDLYDADGDTQGYWEGAGEWSIMASGSWNNVSGVTQPGGTPALPDALLKAYQGWITPTVASNNNTYNIPTASSNAYALQLGSNPSGIDWDFYRESGTGEYWLVENRQLSGYDAGLPGCGLLIWHIDETVSYWNNANGNPDTPLAAVEEADGLADLYYGNDRGDAGDPYPGTSNRLNFSGITNPNSNYHNGTTSNLGVSLVTTSCASTMQVQYASVAPVQDVYLYLPIVAKPRVPYTGSVTNNGVPVGGVTLKMAYTTNGGSNWTAPYASTTSDASGNFSFNEPPDVGGSKKFAVYFDNPTKNANYLAYFECNMIDSSSDPYSCAINLRDVVLKTPAPGAGVGPKVTFTWNRRSTTTDTYHWWMTDTSDDSYYYWKNMGYVASATITFCGFYTYYEMDWWMELNTPNGYGVSYYYNPFFFKTMNSCSPALGPEVLSPEKRLAGPVAKSSLLDWLVSTGEVDLPLKK